jgi:hypothetical protein
VTPAITGTSATITVSPAAATHFVVSAPAVATAGASFNFSVTAKDQFNNTATGYGGTVHFTSSDAQAVLPADSTLTAGTGTFSATLKTAGPQTITATDTVTPAITGTSATITVSPAAANHFSVVAPANVTSNVAFTFSVTAKDLFNNTVTGYTGTVHFTSTDLDAGTVLPADYTFVTGENGSHTFSAKLQTVGSQTITATDTANATITGTSNPILVGPNALLGQVATTDADFKNVDGFDVLFTKGSSNSVLKLKNTNPGTFHYLLTLTNETGATIHDNTVLNSANGATASVILTVPALPTGVGTAIPASAAGYTSPNTSAFTAQGGKPVHAHPDDKTDEMSVQVSYAASAPGGDCSAATYTNGQPPDGAVVKCIKITGFSIPKHHTAKIDVSYEFAVKNTDGWNTNAQAAFRAGFAFKSSTNVHLDVQLGSNPSGNYSGNQVAGLVGAGQQVTAVGGFVFDTNGNGVAGRTVKLYNTAVADCSGTAVASVTTQLDGFYFIYKTGPDQTDANPNNLPSGVKYYVGACSTPTGTFSAARYIDHKLANKEFDEEDFYITP